MRRLIVDTLRDAEEHLPAPPDRAPSEMLRLLENPERTVDRLDRWLRDRVC